MSAGTFGALIAHGNTIAKTSVATVVKSGGGKAVTLRAGANGVTDNQKIQAIAESLGRGDVSETDINA